MHERQKQNADQKGKTKFKKKWKEHSENRENDRVKTEGSYNNSGRWQKEEQATKIKMHTKIQFTACNVRGINALGKRQELARQWAKNDIDIAMLSETQNNTGGMEAGGPWGK